MEFKTGIQVYTDDDAHQHYDFVIDKEHMQLIKGKGKLTPEENEAWKKIRSQPDDFFKKAHTLMLMVNMLHALTQPGQPEES